jgi:hypothetical protein
MHRKGDSLFLLLRVTKETQWQREIAKKKFKRQNKQTPGWQSRAE